VILEILGSAFAVGTNTLNLKETSFKLKKSWWDTTSCGYTTPQKHENNKLLITPATDHNASIL